MCAIPTVRGTSPVSGLGSGFIISPEGYVVTNNHVISGADQITVIFNNGIDEVPAELVGTDPKTDIAVLKIDPSLAEIQNVSWGNSEISRVGDIVLAIGNPLGLGGTVTSGIISSINRDIGGGPYVDFIQTDAPINRGNSGGPLFNLDGGSYRYQFNDYLPNRWKCRIRIFYSS